MVSSAEIGGLITSGSTTLREKKVAWSLASGGPFILQKEKERKVAFTLGCWKFLEKRAVVMRGKLITASLANHKKGGMGEIGPNHKAKSWPERAEAELVEKSEQDKAGGISFGGANSGCRVQKKAVCGKCLGGTEKKGCEGIEIDHPYREPGNCCYGDAKVNQDGEADGTWREREKRGTA